MAELYNPKTKRVEQLPDDVAAQALASGQYQIPGRGVRVVNMVKPSGETVGVSTGDVVGALGQGFKLESRSQEKQRYYKEQYGEGFGDELKAFASGAARGLTFGLSDHIMKNLGVEAETLKGLKMANPYADMTGEVIGVGGSLLVPGTGAARVAGLAQRGVAAAGLAPRMVAKGGLAIERALAGSSPGAARALAAKATGAAAEGAAYGAGQAISEAALDDKDLTAEAVLAHAGTGAALAGAAGGALLGVGIGVRSGTRLGLEFTKKTAEQAAKLYKNATGIDGGPAFSNYIAKAYGKLASMVSGADEKFVAELMSNREKLRQVMGASDDRAVFAREMTEILDDDAGSTILENIMGEKKLRNIERMLKDGTEADIRSSSLEIFDKMGQELDDMISGGVGEYGFQGQLKKFKKIVDSSRAKFWTEKNAAKMYSQLDVLKRDIGKWSYKHKTFHGRPSQDVASIENVQSMYERLRRHLEKEDLFGEMGKAQKEINEAVSDLLSDKPYRQNFWVPFTKDKRGVTQFRSNPEKLRQFVDGLGLEKNKLDEEFLQARMTKTRDAVERITKYYQLGPKDQALLQRVRGNTDRFFKAWDKASDTVSMQNRFEDLAELSSRGLGAGFGALGAGAILGPVGAPIGALYGLARDPAGALRSLYALQRMSDAVVSRLDGAISGAIKTLSKPNYQVTGLPMKPIRRLPHALAALLSDKFDSDPYDAYEESQQKLADMTGNPGAVMATVSESLSGVGDAAPEVHEKAVQMTMDNLTYLHGKIMKQPDKFVLSPGDRPSKREVLAFRNYVSAVNDPMGVVEDIGKGVATVEGIEVLKERYPKIHQQLVNRFMLRMQDPAMATPDRNTVLRLSDLLGVPLARSLDPGFVARAQAVYNRQPRAGQGMNGVRLTGISNVTLGKRTQTASQRMETT